MEFLEALDQGTWNFFQASHSQRPLISQLMVWVGMLTSPPVLAGIVLLTAACLLYGRRRREAGLLVGLFVTAWLIAWLTQALIDRPRPQVLLKPLEVPGSGSSFPCTQTLLAAMLFLSLPALARPPWQNRLIGVGAVLVFLVGVSRIYVCQSYVTDMFAGLFVGYALALTFRSLSRMNRWRLSARLPMWMNLHASSER